MEDTQRAIPSYYDELGKMDLIDKLAPMFAERLIKIDLYNRITPGERWMAYDLPWIASNIVPGRPCDFWLLAFQYIGFVPRQCLGCWKVVVRPQTIYELFELYKFQQGFGSDCKCGIEVRPYVFGNYGGYFYNRTRAEGEVCYLKVRAGMDKINKGMSVILKRACTEMEQAFGPSNTYDERIPKDHDHWSDLIDQWVDLSAFAVPQSAIIKAHIQRKWIRHAEALGDRTVRDFTGGRPLNPEVYTYHDKSDSTVSEDKLRQQLANVQAEQKQKVELEDGPHYG